MLDSGASENFISSSFVSHWGLPTLPLRQPFTARAAKGSSITVNTFVRSLLRFEGVQLHFGLRVIDIYPDVILGHPFHQKDNPIIDLTSRSMCLRVRNRTHVVRAVAAIPHPSSVVLNHPSGVRHRFLCTDPPYAQSRARAPLPVPYVPLTWQAGDSLSETEALDVSLLNFIS